MVGNKLTERKLSLINYVIKAFLVIFFSICWKSANAEWQHFFTSNRGDVYVDPASIQRSNNFVKMWHAESLRNSQKTLLSVPPGSAPTTANVQSYSSAKFLYEYDCYNSAIRKIETVYFENKDLTGKIIFKEEVNTSTGLSRLASGLLWVKKSSTEVPFGDKLFNFVCSN